MAIAARSAFSAGRGPMLSAVTVPPCASRSRSAVSIA